MESWREEIGKWDGGRGVNSGKVGEERRIMEDARKELDKGRGRIGLFKMTGWIRPCLLILRIK